MEPVAGSYFVSTYPPFSVWTGDAVGAYRSLLDRPPAIDAGLGLYVHIPFCLERCRYCYYLSYANPNTDLVDRYIDAVLDEAARYARLPALAGRPLSYVYFGGGTPSMLTASQIHRVLAGIRGSLPWDGDAEVTFECAPRSALPDRLNVLRDEGLTRLSMGVQQLDDEVLARNARVHTVRDVERAWADIQKIGFEVVNLDLIVGLVGETDATFFESLGRVIGMGADSVTLYQLEIPLNTPLYRSLQEGEELLSVPSWSTKRRRLDTAFSVLEGAGYHQRSAYAAVKDPERHRFVYQDAQYRGADLLGIGASSFSFVQGGHQQNAASMRSYLEVVESGELPHGRAHMLSENEQCVREFVLQLKLGGCDASQLHARYGVAVTDVLAEPLARFEHEGWVVIDDDQITVTREGLLRVDALIPELYPEERQDVRYS